MNKVFVISASHNSLSNTKKFIKSFNQQSYKNKTLIFVDDGSTDGTYEWLKNNTINSHIIKGSGKLWWTGAIYLGIETALETATNKDYILTINSDCIFDKNYISNIIKFIDSHPKAIVGSVALDPKNKKPTDAGIKMDWNNYKFLPQLNMLKQKQTSHQVDVVSTKGTLYPVNIVRKIGNFDRKNLPHYLSDYEYSCRASRFGYKILVHHESEVFSDPKNTGYETGVKLAVKKMPKLLFSRKSKVNIFDHINFIGLCCPKNLKIRSYFHLLKNIFIRSKST